MMVKLFLVALCLFSTPSLTHSSALTKENQIEQTPKVALKAITNQIRNTNIPAEILKLVFKSPEELISNLNELLTTKSNPEVSEVLDIFNNNLGTRLLIVNGEYIQIDPRAYQLFLSNQAIDVSRNVFPRNFFQQLGLYGFLVNEFQRSSEKVNLNIEQRKVPVEVMTALIASDGHTIAKRDTLSDLFTSVATTLCNSVVTLAYDQLNSTLISVNEFLSSISIDSDSDNVFISLVEELASLLVSIAEDFISGFNEIAAAFADSLCSDLLNSTDSSTRKRRDLSAFDLNKNVALSEPLIRDVASRSILSSLWDVVWSYISGILNTTLTSLVSSLITVVENYFDSFLESTLADFLYGIIDSLFPSS